MVFFTKKGAGFPVIFLHGFPSDHSIWDDAANRFQSDYAVLQPDFPGAGQSDFLSDALTMEDLSDAIASVFEQEQLERAILVAHSMGGYAALNFAGRFPQRVAGLALVHSSAYPDDDAKKQNRQKAMQLIAKEPMGRQTFLKAMVPNLFAPAFVPAHPETVSSVLAKGMTLPGEALRAFYHAMITRESEVAVLENARFPVQWIIGGQDTAVDKDDLLKQASIASINAIAYYPDCGHMSMVECPERLYADLAAFFDYVTGR